MVAKVLAAGIAIAAVAIAILSVPTIRHLREQPPAPPPSLRLSLTAPPGAELGYWDQTLDAAISPDERQIVFVATKGGTTGLWRRALDEERAQPIAGTEGAQQPAWKATGNVIAFFAGERLRQVSLPDGAVRDLAVAPGVGGASWLPDGSLLFSTGARSSIQRLRDGEISPATNLRPNERAHVFPIATGRNDSFVYTAILGDGRRTVRLVSNPWPVSDRYDRELATTTGHGQLVDNVLLHARDQVLVGQRLNAETLVPEGRAIPLALDVGTGQSGATLFAASSRLLITAPRTPAPRQLTWFTTEGERGRTERDPGDTWQVRLSPDDRYAAVTVSTPLLRTLDVEIIPIADSASPMFRTRAVAADSDPVWSPDGRRVIFRSLQDGTPKLFTNAALLASEDDEIVPMSRADETPSDWRGDRVLAHAPGARGDFDLVAIDMATGVRTPVVTSQFNDTDARLSPDGRWMTYVSDESGAPDIYAQPQPGGQRVRVSFGGGTRPRWGRNGRTLFFLRGSQIMRSDLASAAVFGTARMVVDSPGIRDFDVAHRRDALLALIAAGTSTPATAPAIVDWRSLVN